MAPDDQYLLCFEAFEGSLGGPRLASLCGQAAHEAMAAMGFDLEHVLYANCTCPDEVNRKGPWWDSLMGRESSGQMTFNLGGLAGLPAVGKTGLKACASHVSTDSKRKCIFVFCGSHVGVDGLGQVGKVKRAHQCSPSSSCGAAVAAHKWATSNQLYEADPDDAQMDECKLCVKAEIERVGDNQALLAQVVYEHAFNRLCALIPANLNQNCPVVLLGGIQLNTDDGRPDYFAPRHFILFDAGQEKYVDKSDLFVHELTALIAALG